jgi:hypothetical protein
VSEAATPTTPTITVTRRGSGRSYAIDGRPVPGVTSVIDAGYPKAALQQWAADETARYALEHADELAELGRIRAYDKLRRARYLELDKAKVFGSDVHRLAEKLSAGEEVEVPPQAVGHVDQALKFFDEHDVHVRFTETTVANATVGYCGTFDLLADTCHGPALIDYKTSKSGPYPEAALQLAAYRHAEWMLTDGVVVPMVPVDLCAVCWLRAETYELIPVTADASVFRAFRYVAQVAQVAQADRSVYIGEAL